MKILTGKTLSYLLLALLFAGCPPPKPIVKEVPPPKPIVEKKPPMPEIMLNISSLNLAKYTKKIEKNDILKFADQLKRDSIDIVLIQGITRYPELKTRVDIVDELARAADLRKVFGETITLTGRQNGNAVFSLYPIRSNENTPYNNLQNSNFEAALQVIIDCGAREIVVVSTQLPEKSPASDQSVVATTLGSYSNLYYGKPVIISGNLPKSENTRALANYDEVRKLRTEDIPLFWYSGDGSLKLTAEKIEQTVLGKMSVVRFGVFRKQ
jgi:endonuclease/exonuclease/phosphatase family metal-dependent hydrolase